MIERVVYVMICGRCRHVNGLDPGYRPEVGNILYCRNCRSPHDVLSVNPFSVLVQRPAEWVPSERKNDVE